MSDIPVGSPPAPPGRHAAPGGWYADPLDASRERYWDGWQWSRTTRAFEGAVRQPTAPAAAAVPAYLPRGGGPNGSYAPTAARPRQATHTADGVALAGWWWRALAGLLDAFFVGTVTSLLTLPFYRELLTAFSTFYTQLLQAVQSGGVPPASPNFAAMISGTDRLLVMVIALAVGLAYHVPFLRKRSATPGLLACGLRVVPMDEGRSEVPLTWTCVLVRAAIWVLPGALGLRILTVADVLIPLWHPRRQTLHDLAAQTQVVRLR